MSINLRLRIQYPFLRKLIDPHLPVNVNDLLIIKKIPT